jgi:pyruvate dehydrogenase E2 component (dihydrolipoamide acetyltransferase)
MNAPLRQFVSPYARKLAGERGIQLVDLSGSGPAGRIVAADVLSFVKPAPAIEVSAPPPSNPAPVVVPAVMIAAFATQIDLGPLRQLQEQFAGAQVPLSIDALLVRAAGRSLASLSLNAAIGWEAGSRTDKREIAITEAGSLSLGTIQKQIEAASTADPGQTPMLSIRCIAGPGIRAVSMPLKAGHAMRLVLSSDHLTIAECLLCFDGARIAEDDAITFLAQFKADIENPLSLLA